MPESSGHKTRKNKAAGIWGNTDHPLPSGRRLDALSATRIATEIERGGPTQIKKAVNRLKEARVSGEARKIRLRVNESELDTAYSELDTAYIRRCVTNEWAVN